MRVPLLPTAPDDTHLPTEKLPSDGSTASPLVVRIFFASLGLLLLGYMFAGRGFAHLGVPPVFVGEVVLALGLVATVFVIVARRPSVRAWRLEWLVIAFMIVGALRTVPYLPEYGVDALRDGVLWGYGLFALIIVLLADRRIIGRTLPSLVLVIPFFALWLPIAWNIFASASADIDPGRPGEFVPLVFFKAGDMAVHVTAACAVLVLGTAPYRSVREFLVRVAVGLPLLWTAFISATSNRGALLTFAAGIVVLALIAGRRRNWIPLGGATILLVAGLAAPAAFEAVTRTAEPAETARPSATPSRAPSTSPSATIGPSSSPGGPPGPTTDPGNGGSLPDVGGRTIGLRNAGFESGPVSTGRIEGWSVSGVGTFNIAPGEGRAGSRAAVLVSGGAPFQTWIQSESIPLPPEDDIFVAVWVRTITGEPRLEIYVNWSGADGASLGREYLGFAAPANGGRWNLAAGALKPPAGVASAQVQLWEARGEGAIAVDEVTIRAGDFVVLPPPPRGRPAQFEQFIENILSIFMPSSDRNLEGTKQFRLAWWGAIVDYTVFGDYFWTGKGFGVNLADADGFQSTADRSLRAPHNSHLTVLARMGVPGFVLWVALQAAFAVSMLWALWVLRRRGDVRLAALAGVLIVYWVGAMVDTSFDPYLEGPQGGIWFWSIIGLGLVVIRSARRPAST